MKDLTIQNMGDCFYMAYFIDCLIKILLILSRLEPSFHTNQMICNVKSIGCFLYESNVCSKWTKTNSVNINSNVTFMFHTNAPKFELYNSNFGMFV